MFKVAQELNIVGTVIGSHLFAKQMPFILLLREVIEKAEDKAETRNPKH